MTIVGLKELRANMENYIKLVEKGEEVLVTRRAKPLFTLRPPVDEGWEEVIDFTKLKKGGVRIEELLKRL